MRLAMAYGTSLPKGSTITTSRDTSRIARALKRALIAGINLSGVNVEDIELATVPLTRFQVRNSRSQGGITVRLAPGDPDTVEIRFFDGDGRDIDPSTQRKIERLLYREDYRRAFGGEIGDIVFPPRSLEFYTAALERVVDIEQVRERVVQDRARLLVRRRVDRDAEPAHEARRRGARGEPVREHASASPPPRSATRSVARLAELVRASGSDLGFVIDPDGELATVVDDTGHILEPGELLLAIVSLVERGGPDARVAVPVNVTSAVETILGATDAVVRTKLWGASLMEAAAARRHVRRHARRRVHLARLPARLRRRGHAGEAARPARRRRPAAVHGGRGAAVDPRRARDDRHAVGAQGHGDARDRRDAPASREIELIDGVKVIDRRSVGAGAARPRGRADPRVGGGGQRRRGRAAPRAGVRAAHPPGPALTRSRYYQRP